MSGDLTAGDGPEVEDNCGVVQWPPGGQTGNLDLSSLHCSHVFCQSPGLGQLDSQGLGNMRLFSDGSAQSFEYLTAGSHCR